MKECPICQSARIFKVFTSETYSIFGCLSCKNAFTDPLPKAPSYEEMDFHAGESVEQIILLKYKEDLHETWQKSLDMQVKLILKNTKPEDSILEIGCGEGYLLYEIFKDRPHVFGIEPSKTSSKRAISKGLQVELGYFSPETVGNKKFDIIIMSHVLEHIENIHSTLDLIMQSLNDQGKLLLIQTNYRGLLPRFRKDKWYAWVPSQHFWHFTPKGLAKITDIYGFKPLECEFSSLIHGGMDQWINKIASRYAPSWLDQFHLILQKK